MESGEGASNPTHGRTELTGPGSHSPAAKVPPQLVNHPRYRVINLLGEGGMGAVYLAEHIKMERRVALKVMRADLVSDASHVQRFQQEVRAASKLSHPNIVTAYDADEAGSGANTVHFLVMEFVEGETLLDYVRRREQIPVAEACECVRQAALGLQHAFEQGMVHRDIKPANLIRSAKGEIKILDFGLARLALERGSTAPAPLTNEGMVMGTVDYMAPEQAGDSHGVDIRADIYSLGCTLYQLLAGCVPFPDGAVAARLVQHATRAPQDVRKFRPDVPAGLGAALKKMLAKKPSDRFATPADVAAAMEPFANLAAGTTIDARPRTLPSPLAHPSVSRKIALWGGACVAILIAMGFSAWKLFGSKRDNASSGTVTAAAPAPLPLTTSANTAPAVSNAAAKPTTTAAPATVPSASAGAGQTTKPAVTAPPPLQGNSENKPPTTGAANTPRPAPANMVEEGEENDKEAALYDNPGAAVKSEKDYSEAHGLAKGAFSSWLEGLRAKEMIPIVMNAQAGPSDPRFNAIAVKDPRSKNMQIEFDMAMSARELPATGHLWLSCLYVVGDAIKRARILMSDRRLGTHWMGPVESMKERLAEHAGQHQHRPVNISAAQLPGGFNRETAKFGAGKLNWEVHAEVPQEKIRALEAEIRRRGWRPEIVEPYGYGDTYHFTVQEVENPQKIEWSMLFDISRPQFETALKDKAKNNMRPIWIGSWGTLDNPRYTAIWVQMATH
ncbi:MAG TPA: protein kinase [Planctomycetota bacterium]|nr:protein kinase [Planctomycetota bacterium]